MIAEGPRQIAPPLSLFSNDYRRHNNHYPNSLNDCLKDNNLTIIRKQLIAPPISWKASNITITMILEVQYHYPFCNIRHDFRRYPEGMKFARL